MNFNDRMLTEESASQLLSNYLIMDKIWSYLPFENLLELSTTCRHWRSLCRTELRKRKCVAILGEITNNHWSLCVGMKNFNDLMRHSEESPFSGVYLFTSPWSIPGPTCSISCFDSDDPNPRENFFPFLQKPSEMWQHVYYMCPSSYARCPAIRTFRILFAQNSTKVKSIYLLRIPDIIDYKDTFQDLVQYANPSELYFPQLKNLHGTTLDFYVNIKDLAPNIKTIWTYHGPLPSNMYPVVPESFCACLVDVNFESYVTNYNLYKKSTPTSAYILDLSASLYSERQFQSKLYNATTYLSANLCKFTAHIRYVAFISVQNIRPFVNLKKLCLLLSTQGTEEELVLDNSSFKYINFSMFPRLHTATLEQGWPISLPPGVQFHDIHSQAPTVKVLEFDYFSGIKDYQRLQYLAVLFPNIESIKIIFMWVNDEKTRQELFLRGYFTALKTLEVQGDYWEECSFEFLANVFGLQDVTSLEDVDSSGKRLPLSPALLCQSQLKTITLHIPHKTCISFNEAIAAIQKLLSVDVVKYIRTNNSNLKIVLVTICKQCAFKFKSADLKVFVRHSFSSQIYGRRKTETINEITFS